jgi:hypothetical protein
VTISFDFQFYPTPTEKTSLFFVCVVGVILSAAMGAKKRNLFVMVVTQRNTSLIFFIWESTFNKSLKPPFIKKRADPEDRLNLQCSIN